MIDVLEPKFSVSLETLTSLEGVVVSETGNAATTTMSFLSPVLKWGIAVSLVLFACAALIAWVFTGVESFICTPNILLSPLRSFGFCTTTGVLPKGSTAAEADFRTEDSKFNVCSIPVVNIPFRWIQICESTATVTPALDFASIKQLNALADLQVQAGYGGALRQYLSRSEGAIGDLINSVEGSELDNRESLRNHLVAIGDSLGHLESQLSEFGGEVHALVYSVKGNSERTLKRMGVLRRRLEKQEAQDHLILHLLDPLSLFHYGPSAAVVSSKEQNEFERDFFKNAVTISEDIPEILSILGILQDNLRVVEKHVKEIGRLDRTERGVGQEKDLALQARGILTQLWDKVTGEEVRLMDLFKANAQLLDEIGSAHREAEHIVKTSLSLLEDMKTESKQLRRLHTWEWLRKKGTLKEAMDNINGAVKRLSSPSGIDAVQKTATVIQAN
ncbi:hypothetical protein SLS54_008894 [Diplodia seriata]